MATDAVAPPEQAVRAELDRILASRAFARSQRQRRFLRFVVETALEGKPETLKESVLGVSVFDRGPDFDPRADNIVRVEARRLRQRLEDYYREERPAGEVAIELPTGSYVPHFSWLAVATEAEATPPDAAGQEAAGRRKPVLFLAAAGLAVAALGGILWFAVRQPVSIAVLPFSDFSPGSAEQYRADAVAEDITQALAAIPRLKVVSRTSAFQFRGGGDAREVGRRLGVRMLLEGSVQKYGEGFRIAARLVSAKDGFEVWSGTREVEEDELEAGERSIVTEVARALGVDPPRAPATHAPPAEARDLVLRARFLAGRGGQENRVQALDYYTRATALDPGYARAWAEQARLLSLMAFHDSEAAPRLAPQARHAARRALSLDDSLADAHLALARVAWSHDWDWRAADQAFRKALEHNPNHAGARQAYALALMSRRRFRESIAESRRAMELDPLSFAASNDLGVILYASRRYEEAAAHARQALALAPESVFPRFLLGVVRAGQGRHRDAARELEAAVKGMGRAASLLGRLGHAYARSGRRAEAEALLDELGPAQGAGSVYVAMVQTGLGNREEALRALEASASARETDLLFIGADPIFDPLRSEPRFAAICRRLGLRPE